MRLKYFQRLIISRDRNQPWAVLGERIGNPRKEKALEMTHRKSLSFIQIDGQDGCRGGVCSLTGHNHTLVPLEDLGEKGGGAPTF